MRSLFILIVVQLLFIQCTSDIRDDLMDPISPTVPVTGLTAPVELHVLRIPDHFTKDDLSTHRKADFRGIISQDGKTITASVIQYFHPDDLPARFVCFYPKPDTLRNGIASYTLDGSQNIIYAPVANAGTLYAPNPDFGFNFRYKLSRLHVVVSLSQEKAIAEDIVLLSLGVLTYNKLQLKLDGPLAGQLHVAEDAKKVLLPIRDDSGAIVRSINPSKNAVDCGSVYVYPGENPVLALKIQEKNGTFTQKLSLPTLTPGKEYLVEVTGDVKNVLFNTSLSDWIQGDSGVAKF
ncbi:MAG: fimbrillin family protein [Bacteroidales bacterium]|jgi:hypothetical protein|nr:fimbrillin family protein [Bacteroidales bacterium]